MTQTGLNRRALLCAMSLTLSLLGTAAFAQDVTLKFHQFLPSGASVPKEVLIPWMEKVAKESNGRIKFEHYPAMQMGGKPGELIDQVIEGVVDIVWTLPGYTPGRFPRTEVMELPFIMTNAEASSRAYWELGEKYMIDTELKDVKVLALWNHGPGLIHSAKPVRTPDDLKGVKLRAPTRVTNMMVTDLGATSVGMPVPGIPEAMSKGVIEAAVVPWEVTPSLKLSEMVKNHTEFPGAPLYTSSFIMAMNHDSYNNLPDDLKAVIDANSGAETSAWAGKQTEGADVPGRELAVSLGNTIIELTPAEIEPWKQGAQNTIDTWVKESAAAGFDGQALLDEARALVAKHTK